MEFKKFIIAEQDKKRITESDTPSILDTLDTSPQETETYFSKEDIIEMIEILDDDEIQEIGEELMEMLYDEDEDYDSDENTTLDEKKYFAKKANQVNREKKKDKATRRKDAKKRKKFYKQNKAKIKRKQKLYKKKTKRQPNQVRKHR